VSETTGSAPYLTVGVDGSPSADDAVDWAVQEAVRRDLELQIVAVWSTPLTVVGPVPSLAVPNMVHAARSAAHRCADVAAKRAADAGVAATTEVIEGHAAEVLTAIGRGADQIVVGAHGRSAIGRALLGSVSTAVVHHATGPVTVVRRPLLPARPRVVVGVDGSLGARVALRRAAVEARAAEAQLHVVTAWRLVDDQLTMEFSGRGLPSADDVSELAEATARQLLDDEAEHLDGCRVRFELVHGEPGRALCDRSSRAALVVVGSRGFGPFDRMLVGSTSTDVMHHARCPVQVVPAGP
jgi:nucleotide-binding universal stress UspA family protein